MILPCAGSGENREGWLLHTQFNSTLALLIDGVTEAGFAGVGDDEKGSHAVQRSK